MPQYTFSCRACEQEFERFSWDDLEEVAVECPACGGEAALRWVVEMPFENRWNVGC